jgi:hypothetical protein
MMKIILGAIATMVLLGCNNQGKQSDLKSRKIQRNIVDNRQDSGDTCGEQSLKLDQADDGDQTESTQECDAIEPSPSMEPSPSPSPKENNTGTSSSTNTSTSTSTSADTVTFRIKSGTGQGPWNTEAETVKVKVGQKLEIINDDSTPHRLHTSGRPCPHQPKDINKGEKFVCEIRRTLDLKPGDEPRTYDHNAGEKSFFYLKADP